MPKPPIVPLETSKPISRKFEKHVKNELNLRCKVGGVELSFFSSLESTQRDAILDKVLAYGTHAN